MGAPENSAAFPRDYTGMGGHPGMSLRDYIAAKALVGLVANPNNSGSADDFARLCYAISDAMLRERSKNGGLS